MLRPPVRIGGLFYAMSAIPGYRMLPLWTIAVRDFFCVRKVGIMTGLWTFKHIGY
jgi:hypothetical protein